MPKFTWQQVVIITFVVGTAAGLAFVRGNVPEGFLTIISALLAFLTVPKNGASEDP